MNDRTRRLISLASLTVIVVVGLKAGGSTYSRYGVGDILSFSNSRSYAFGGASIALIGDGFINCLNPAGLAHIRYTRFSGDFEISHLTSRTDEGTASSGFGRFNGAALAIPIDTAAGVVLSLEATPYSSVRYAVSTADTTSFAASDQTYRGDGGLTQLSIGLSTSLTNTIHVGAKFQYTFGTLHQYATATFRDETLSSSTFDRTVRYTGFAMTGGVILERVGDLVGSTFLTPLTLGVILQAGGHADLSEEEIVASTDTNYRRSGSSELPFSFGAGMSYLAAERYLIAGDVYAQQWGSVKVDGVHPAELRNSLRIALGVEILPERGVESYWKRTAYRAGAYYQSSYLRLNGEGIDEYGVTAGFGLPIGPDSRLNLGFQFGRRGTTANGLQQDVIFRISVGVSASEIWFMRFAEE